MEKTFEEVMKEFKETKFYGEATFKIGNGIPTRVIEIKRNIPLKK